ncbi:MAG: SPOR domain-containing protein [Leeuwenhoekiella sp.]
MKKMTLKPILFGLFLVLNSYNALAQEAEVTIIQDSKIPELLALKSQMIKNNELEDRYKIQIMGFGDLKDANEVIDDFKKSFDKWPANVAYQSPNYKVWVGHFADRLEADRALLEVKKEFPNAFVFRPNSK